MARTKQVARKDNEKKRAHESRSSQDAPPSKKSKKNHPLSTSTKDSPPNIAHTNTPKTSRLEPSSRASASESLSIPLLDSKLENAYNVTTMSIISSSHIQQKVTRALDILSIFPPPANEKPRVVMLHAKAPVASKMISIAEIAKRELATSGGKWFQYNKVEQIMVERREDVRKPSAKEEKEKEKEKVGGDQKSAGEDISESGGGDQGAESEEETEAFETMKTPFERANEGKPKMRAVPVMTLYLSRIRIENLRKAYGEQTNGLEVPL